MTNKEAIEILKQIPLRYLYGRRVNGKQNTIEALILAIKALEERPTSEWIMNKTSPRGRNYTCKHCEKISRNKFEYCPKCGAKMREAKENE